MEPIYIHQYDYELPDNKIAKYPLENRDGSKLLIYKEGKINEKKFTEITEELEKGSLLVYNNTKVIQARMIFHKSTGARIEIFCLEPVTPSDYALSFASQTECVWKCMVGNLKKWKSGSLERQIQIGENTTLLSASISSSGQNAFNIHFTWDNPTFCFADILDHAGELPIPPYLNRETEENDKKSYQTVYSKISGSVAAPTAGLHFTPQVLTSLNNIGVSTEELTLHVGAGTFKPVKANDISEHQMHTEIISVRKETIQNILAHQGPIIAVGTTTVRTLESLYYIGLRLLREQQASSSKTQASGSELQATSNRQQASGLKLQATSFDLENSSEGIARNYTVGQWEPYENKEASQEVNRVESFKAILNELESTGQKSIHAQTQIMIRPGYKFRVIDGLITNFHQPRSTLLLLVSALIGEDWKKVYEYALSHEFRFLSYGDSSLLFPINQSS